MTAVCRKQRCADGEHREEASTDPLGGRCPAPHSAPSPYSSSVTSHPPHFCHLPLSWSFSLSGPTTTGPTLDPHSLRRFQHPHGQPRLSVPHPPCHSGTQVLFTSATTPSPKFKSLLSPVKPSQPCPTPLLLPRSLCSLPGPCIHLPCRWKCQGTSLQQGP